LARKSLHSKIDRHIQNLFNQRQERSMPRIEEHIEIAAARVDVFRFCHDVASRAEWDEQVTQIELLTSRPIRTGTLFRVDTSYSGGSVFTWDAEYVDFKLPSTSTVRVLDTAASSPFGAGSELIWEFSSVGNETRFTWIWDYRPRGFLAKIADILGRRAATQRTIKRSMANLKTLIESGRRATVS
jgi:hypothetical protein